MFTCNWCSLLMGILRSICRLRSWGCRATLFISIILCLFTVHQNVCRYVNLSPCCVKEPITMQPRALSNMTRNSSYKNIRFRINSNQCQGQPKWLVIGVISRVEDFEERDVVRKTWGSLVEKSHVPVVLVFVVGEKKTLKKPVRLALEKEQVENKDIVQIDLEDTYSNLVLKSIGFLKWATEFCNGFKHLLKVDSDVFLNMHNLIKVIEMVQTEPKFIMGQVLRDSKPNRNKKSKHYVSMNDFPETHYPTYITGAAYVISEMMARELVTVMDKTPLVVVEDVFITGLCARQVGGVFIGDCGFSYHDLPLNEVMNYPARVTLHGFKKEQFYSLWKQINMIKTVKVFNE